MKRSLRIVFFVFLVLSMFGCAAEKVYVVTEAKAVTQQALEPVVINPGNLVKSLKAARPSLSAPDNIEKIMSDIREQVEKTKRFKSIFILRGDGVTSEKEGFVIFPEIIEVRFQIGDTWDTQRKRFIATAKGRLKIYDIDNTIEEIAVYNSEKKYEKMGRQGQIKLSAEEQDNQLLEVIKYVFLDLAYKLGDDFNPSYEMGTVEKIAGKTVHVRINTSRLKGIKAKQQSVDVIDDDNKVLASVEIINIGDGVLTGTYHEKSGVSVKTGMTVRARINKVK